MTHREIDELLELARGGDPADGEVRRHVDGCARCADEMRGVVRLDAASRAVPRGAAGRTLVVPDGSVWDRIQAELEPAGPIHGSSSVYVSSRSSWRPSVVAAAIGLVLGGVGGFAIAGHGPSSPDRPPLQARTPLAKGTMISVGQDAGSGRMTMSGLEGSRSLTITFDRPAVGAGYLEAWLLDPVTDEMLGLGVIGADGGTVTVPADADLKRFTMVDVSREPFDGDPAHSADSISRGVLRGA